MKAFQKILSRSLRNPLSSRYFLCNVGDECGFPICANSWERPVESINAEFKKSIDLLNSRVRGFLTRLVSNAKHDHQRHCQHDPDDRNDHE